MGHQDGSIQARYTHITPVMRQRLAEDLTGLWIAALDARAQLAEGSPVAALDRLLTEQRKEAAK